MTAPSTMAATKVRRGEIVRNDGFVRGFPSTGASFNRGPTPKGTQQGGSGVVYVSTTVEQKQLMTGVQDGVVRRRNGVTTNLARRGRK